MTYLEEHQPELVIEMQDLCVLVIQDEHDREQEDWDNG